MATYSVAHFLAALAVVLSTRANLISVAAAALLYMAAFSIYQSVIANAATIFGIWALAKLMFPGADELFFSRKMAKSAIAAIIAVGAGGLIYLGGVSLMDLEFDSYQAADQAFSLKGIFNLSYAMEQVIQGSRAFFLWPENYFPNYLKKAQLVFLVAAGIVCVWLPKGPVAKLTAVLILGLTLLVPRTLQMLHPAGDYHNLTLTAYAVVIAGLVMIINRAGPTLIRNLSSLLALFLIAGYILQCNWISTVNYLNTLAHVTTWTQVLASIRSLPDEQWDGKTIAVVGKYNMRSVYPYKGVTGVATKFMDAAHMQHLAGLMRDDAIFVRADEATPKALEYAAAHAPWPHPASVGVVDGIGVVVLSKDTRKEY